MAAKSLSLKRTQCTAVIISRDSSIYYPFLFSEYVMKGSNIFQKISNSSTLTNMPYVFRAVQINFFSASKACVVYQQAWFVSS